MIPKTMAVSTLQCGEVIGRLWQRVASAGPSDVGDQDVPANGSVGDCIAERRRSHR